MASGLVTGGPLILLHRWEIGFIYCLEVKNIHTRLTLTFQFVVLVLALVFEFM